MYAAVLMAHGLWRWAVLGAGIPWWRPLLRLHY
jgi:hypothetical protein